MYMANFPWEIATFNVMRRPTRSARQFFTTFYTFLLSSQQCGRLHIARRRLKIIINDRLELKSGIGITTVRGVHSLVE